MKSFIKHFFVFLSALLVSVISIILIISFIERKQSSFKFKHRPEYLVVGHSHPAFAFNDSLISSLKNVSMPGESYFYNYIKVRQVIKENPSLKLVFIEYTNNQIDESMNNWIWGDKNISIQYPRYSSYLNLSENALLFRKNPSAFINALSVSIKRKSSDLFLKNIYYSSTFGGYNHWEIDETDSLKIDSLINVISKEKSIPVDVNISKVNLAYLDSLITICEKNDIKVILIRSPQHEKYNGYRNEKTFIKILETRYSDLEFLDFAHFPLSKDEFGDLHHLNYKGAKKFSKWFDDLLKKGLLKQLDKQKFIENKFNDLNL